MVSGEIAGRAVLVLMDRVGDRVVRMACDPVARDPEVPVDPVQVDQAAVARGRAADDPVVRASNWFWVVAFSLRERKQQIAKV